MFTQSTSSKKVMDVDDQENSFLISQPDLVMLLLLLFSFMAVYRFRDLKMYAPPNVWKLISANKTKQNDQKCSTFDFLSLNFDLFTTILTYYVKNLSF